MPAIIIERQECKEDMWKALKCHIVRSRQKKKEELEEEEAEERLRKLREEQDQRDRMTLEETRDQLTNLHNVLKKLRDEKHQLFLQLKKVLNEDEVRRRMNNARIEQGTNSGPSGGHQQPGFLITPQAPPPARHLYKVGHVPGGVQAPPELVEDSRRGLGEHGGRAVLWNKNHSYSTTATPAYYPGYNQTIISYPILPTLTTHHVVPSTSAPVTSVAAPPISAITTTEREREREREQRENRDRVRELERERDRDEPPVSKPGHLQFTTQTRPQHTQYTEKFYPVRPTHVPIHGGAIPIQQPQQGSKTGSITSGYPVRSSAPSQPQHTTPHASPQPRPTAFQPAGPTISSQQLIYAPQRFTICTTTISAPSGGPQTSLSHIPTHPPSHPVGHPPSHQGNHGPGHPPSSHPSGHPPSHSHPPPHSASHSTSHTTNHVPSHQGSHAITHSTDLHPSHPNHSSHPSHGSHASHTTNHSHPASHSANHPGNHSSNHQGPIRIHPPTHVVSHTSSHGSHTHQPIHTIGHPSVLHSSLQQVHVNVSQGHQGPPGPPSRYTMSNMPRES